MFKGTPMKEFISLIPCNSFLEICAECGSLLNNNGFVAKYYPKNNPWGEPTLTKYLCREDARILYPHYFKNTQEKKPKKVTK